MSMRVLSATVAAAAFLFSASGAFAVAFGPATASLGSFDVPTVVLGGSSGTITLNGGSAQLSAGTGSLSATPYSGSGTGTISFSNTPNTIIANSIPSFFTFNDNNGGTFVFDLQFADTVSYSNSPGVSVSIALYLVGDMREDNANPLFAKTATQTSLTMTFNKTGTSNFSESGSLANPPVPPTVPEPASLALLGLGLAAMGVIRRRNKR